MIDTKIIWDFIHNFYTTRYNGRNLIQGCIYDNNLMVKSNDNYYLVCFEGILKYEEVLFKISKNYKLLGDVTYIISDVQVNGNSLIGYDDNSDVMKELYREITIFIRDFKLNELER